MSSCGDGLADMTDEMQSCYTGHGIFDASLKKMWQHNRLWTDAFLVADDCRQTPKKASVHTTDQTNWSVVVGWSPGWNQLLTGGLALRSSFW
mmetsp:Transcript_139440/g.242520  ORF Transcript_139440/g.242520 Transcript_139440/m.242520 type:complete len:92 (+) Transcript_139440:2044-2319(+)